MKTYEVIKNDVGEQMLLMIEDNRTKHVPMHVSNRHYAEYLRYTEWVEAGNNPEDFWSQSEDFLDTSVSEPSEPKEEETTEGES